MNGWTKDIRWKFHIQASLLAVLVIAALGAAGCGDGMLGLDTGSSPQQRQQAQVIPGRYRPPAAVAEAGRRQAGNINYDDADRCIGTGNPILPGTDRLARFLRDNFSGPTRYDATVYCRPVRGGSSLSMHATGRAIDLYVPTIGEKADNSAGDPVANYLIVNATKLGVQYFIWDHSQFNTERGEVEDYCRGNCWDSGGSKSQHHDHLHIELTKDAAQNLQFSDIPAVGASSATNVEAPDAPRALSPSNDESVWTDSVTLSAEADPDAWSYSFDIERYTGSRWQHYYTYDTSQSSKRFWPASEDAYRWRVRVTTAGGTSDYSAWSTFWYGIDSPDNSGSTGSGSTSSGTTGSGSTGSSNTGSSGGSTTSQPTTNAPADAWPTANERIAGDSVTLQVNAVSGASRYEFEIQVYSRGQWVDYYTYALDASAKEFWPYYSDSAYRWRARANTASGWTDYTEWNVFLYGRASAPSATGTTQPASNAPTGLSPADGGREWGSSVTLACDSVGGASEYEFEIQVYVGGQWTDYYTYDPSSASKKFWPYYSDSAYRWRARAHTSDGWTDYSSWNVFLFGNATRP